MTIDQDNLTHKVNQTFQIPNYNSSLSNLMIDEFNEKNVSPVKVTATSFYEKEENPIMNDYTKNISQSIFSPGEVYEDNISQFVKI